MPSQKPKHNDGENARRTLNCVRGRRMDCVGGDGDVGGRVGGTSRDKWRKSRHRKVIDTRGENVSF